MHTHWLTGAPRDEVFWRRVIKKEIPMYGNRRRADDGRPGGPGSIRRLPVDPAGHIELCDDECAELAAAPNAGELAHDHAMLGTALARTPRAIGGIVDDCLKPFSFGSTKAVVRLGKVHS